MSLINSLKKPRKPSAQWMSLQEVADHFCVSESTIRQGSGVWGELQRVRAGRRVLILRKSVDALDKRLERAAVKLVDGMYQDE